MTTDVNISDINISDAELRVIKILWESDHPMSAEAVARALESSTDWGFATVKTLLSRLMRKKAISAEAEGRRFLYRPEISHQEYLRTSGQRFIDQVFDGRVAPLVSHFSESGRLSKTDIAELRRILDELT